MDARLLVIIVWAALETGLIFGYIVGTKFGVHVAVKAYLKEEGALTSGVPEAYTEYYQGVRASLTGISDTNDARAWTRKHNLPYNSETLALYRDVEYRKGIDGDH